MASRELSPEYNKFWDKLVERDVSTKSLHIVRIVSYIFDLLVLSANIYRHWSNVYTVFWIFVIHLVSNAIVTIYYTLKYETLKL